jgi:uncharacterized protein YjbI with pentapeptide repeats
MQTTPMSPAPPTVSDETLKELAGAANEAARREASQWIAFISLMVFLAISIGTTTHRALLDERPMRLPILNIDVPLVVFFCVAPLIVVIIHFYVQAQLATVSARVARFLAAAKARAEADAAASGGVPDARARLEANIEPLDGFAAAQLGEAAAASRRLAAARLMATVTLTIAPTALLVFFLLKFLPYQSVPVTWFHRVLIVLCLLSSLYFRAVQRDPGTDPLSFLTDLLRTLVSFGPGTRRRAALLIAAMLFLSLATVRGESIDLLDHPLRVSWFLYDGQIDPRTSRPPLWLFSRVLVLPDERLITASESDLRAEWLARTTVLRERNLRGAILIDTDLRRADFTAADLRGARLNGAWLDNAYLSGGRLQGAQLDGATLRGASLGPTKFVPAAHLAGAVLDGADLQGARLDKAEAQGASFERATLRGASLEGAALQGASFRHAALDGAFLLNASIQGASFVSATLRAADLRGVRAWRADFDAAALDLAALPDGVVPAMDELMSNAPPVIEEMTPRSWAAWAGIALADNPNDDMLKNASKRLEPLTMWRAGAGVGATPERSFERVIAEHPAPPPPEGVRRLLGRLACDRDGFPAVLRGILHQIWEEDPRHRRDLGATARKALASHMLDEAACPVAKELPRDSRAQLEVITTPQLDRPFLPAASE